MSTRAAPPRRPSQQSPRAPASPSIILICAVVALSVSVFILAAIGAARLRPPSASAHQSASGAQARALQETPSPAQPTPTSRLPTPTTAPTVTPQPTATPQPTVTPVPTAVPTATPASTTSSNNNGLIALAVIVGILVLAVIGLIVWLMTHREPSAAETYPPDVVHTQVTQTERTHGEMPPPGQPYAPPPGQWSVTEQPGQPTGGQDYIAPPSQQPTPTAWPPDGRAGRYPDQEAQPPQQPRPSAPYPPRQPPAPYPPRTDEQRPPAPYEPGQSEQAGQRPYDPYAQPPPDPRSAPPPPPYGPPQEPYDPYDQ